MYKVIIDNPKLVKLLEDKAESHNKMTEVMQKLMDLDTERSKLALEMEDIKGKVRMIMDETEKDLRDDYDYVSGLKLEDGKAVYEVENMLEDYYKSKEDVAKYILEQAEQKAGPFKDERFFKEIKLPKTESNVA